MSARWSDPPPFKPPRHPRAYRPNNPHGPGFSGRTLAGDLWELQAEVHHARRVILLEAWRHRRLLVALVLALAFLAGATEALWDAMPWAVEEVPRGR